MNICESTILPRRGYANKERKLVDSRLLEFNRANVPFQQSEESIDRSILCFERRYRASDGRHQCNALLLEYYVR
jgi:hypothetical protein